MEKRFIIPALCALLLHAALLLGSRPVEKSAATACLAEKGDKPLPPKPPETVEVTFAVAAPSEAEDEPRKGNTVAANPTGADRSLVVMDRDDFIVPTEPVIRTERREVAVIDPGVIGVPNGNPDGLRLTDGVFDARSLDRVPRALAQIAPRYPAEARRLGLDGEVTVEFTVDESGRVIACRAIGSSSREFESSAINAVRHWRFEPGRRNGRIVRFSMVVPVVFRLNE